MSGEPAGAGGSGPVIPPRLVVLAGRKGRPSLLPFVCVLLVVLTLGLVALLALNTAVNKGAFDLKKKQAEQTTLTQQAEQYQQELAKLSEPGALASQASALGMVPGGNPAFLDPSAGTILGSPTPAGTPAPTATPSATPTSTTSTTATPTTTTTATAPVPPPAGGPAMAHPTTAPTSVLATTSPSPKAAVTGTVPVPVPTPTPTSAGEPGAGPGGVGAGR
jgi:hypothetical protein